ncbi:MAG: hypothetical protein JWQ66_369 [Mucilaginibacter sp.]|nr:hypothetical protein [Mucilaginibacter sp.]
MRSKGSLPSKQSLLYLRWNKMVDKQQILVIENQRIQYETLAERLPEYHILPVMADYSEMTDCVRIWLNERYSPEWRDQVFSHLLSMIEQWDKIDLLIIDYKLSGCHDGHTGMKLAEDFRKTELLKDIPILFLSRTPENEEMVMDELKKISNAHWIPKSYAGALNLDRVYFDKQVKKMLPQLIQQPEKDRLLNILETLINKRLFEDIKEQLTTFRDSYATTSHMSDSQHELVERMFNLGERLTPNDIRTIGNQLIA